MIALLALACSRPPPVDPTPHREVGLSPPPPLELGRLDLSITGAVTAHLQLSSLRCDRDGDVAVFDARRKDPEWSVRYDAYAEPSLYLYVGGTPYLRPATGLAIDRNGMTLSEVEVPNNRPDGGPPIVVTGTIACPAESAVYPTDAVRLIESEAGVGVRPYFTRDFGRYRDARGVSVKVPEERARELVRRLRARLGPGWLVWQGTTRDLAVDAEAGVEVVVASGSSNREALALADVNPLNYGLSSVDVAEWVAAREERFGLVVDHANTEEFTLAITKPGHTAPLATDLAALCPDVISQGVGSMDALVAEIASSGTLYCWWD